MKPLHSKRISAFGSIVCTHGRLVINTPIAAHLEIDKRSTETTATSRFH
ncbi:hypothetical protein QUA56_35065 [Microcoleus sp. N3A4]